MRRFLSAFLGMIVVASYAPATTDLQAIAVLLSIYLGIGAVQKGAA